MINIPKSPMFVYSKQVKEKNVTGEILNRTIDKERISAVIGSLKEIGTERNIEEFELEDNCMLWVNEILSDSSNSKIALTYLLNDFTSSMMTRMREEDKFAVAIISEGILLICHSTLGEKTITPLWKVVDRMLDKDNAERFVLFEKWNGATSVTYYEHSPSEFFTRWLGIPDKEAFYYLGGKNRIYVDIDGVHCVFELTDEDVENKLLKESSLIKVENNQLIFSSPVERLKIGQIRVGKKRYDTISNFFQDYLAKRFDLSHYENKYRNLAESLDVLTYAYIDDIDKVVMVSSDGEQIKVRKRNPNINILFAGNLLSGAKIEMRESFFDHLFIDFINETPIRIFHAGMKMYQQHQGPFNVKSMQIFNEIESNNFIDNLLLFCENTKILDENLKSALDYSIFFLLRNANERKPISYLFNKFLNEIIKKIHKSNVIVQNENDVIEFKSRDYLVGKDDDVSKVISKDVEIKINSHAFKIYFFGIEDKTKKLDPLASYKFSSDRIGSLENKVAKEMNDKADVTLIKVPLEKSDECLLMMIAISKI